MLIGVLIFVLGMILGYTMGHMGKPRLPKPIEPPKPICGCGHHHAYHDPKTGHCNNYQPGVVQASDMKSKVQCKCRHYSGAVPLDPYIAPDIAG
jgi:hypothetical protein